MGIFGALNTAVSGLRAQSFSLENISGNIANSQTTGFKRQDTSFFELVSEGGATQSSQSSGSVNFASRSTTTLQGDIQSATSDTSIAINGDGYFVVERPSGTVDGNTIFTGESFYTRAGDFSLTRNGNFENGAGYALKGFNLDPTTGNRTGSVPNVIELSSDFLPATPTTQIDYRANLPSYPLTSNADINTPESELILGASGFAGATTNITGAQTSNFIDTSISGGALTAYGALGEAVDVQLRWAKVENADDTATPAVADTWNLFYLSDANAGATADSWINSGTSFEFGADGRLTAPTGNDITVTGLTVDGANLGDIRISLGENGVTQFADSNGTVNISELQQDGVPAGEFVDVAFSNGGRLTATYSNGQTLDIAEVALVSFNADAGLRRVDGGGAFEATTQSGEPIANASGTILASSLEASNTDIADEFTKLIVTQQAYSANSRIVTTADEMLSEILNIVR